MKKNEERGKEGKMKIAESLEALYIYIYIFVQFTKGGISLPDHTIIFTKSIKTIYFTN